jgi:D-ribulokinase
MPVDQEIVIGIDVGTSGVRSLAATGAGDVVAEAHAMLPNLAAPPPAHEQDPYAWWRALCQTTQELGQTLKSIGAWNLVRGIAVTSTSGSLVLADSHGEPVRPAILYDDGRAGVIATELNRRVSDSEVHINGSFSLAKALWVREHEPSCWARARHILHPADWLAFKLTGNLGLSDYANALKLGYDAEKQRWTEAVTAGGIPASMLPKIFAPGDHLGVVCARASGETGLNFNVPVLAGASDGLASLIASGASEPGQANSTLGTTIVWKVLSTTKPHLGQGMYCHHLPNKLRVPGAASNTGPGCMNMEEAGVTAAEMDGRAESYLPTLVQCYVLAGRGERFPFLNPQATTFFEGCPAGAAEAYAAQLQSVACVERWGYERLEDCRVDVGAQVFSAGSAAGSPVLSQMRADILDRMVVCCKYSGAAFGAAVLAAGTVLFANDFTAATRAMPRVLKCYTPRLDRVEKFREVYQLFRVACERHGFA